MDDLDQGHELLLRVGPLGEVGDGALVDLGGHLVEAWAHLPDERPVVLDVVHGGDVHARDRRQLTEDALAGGATGALPRRDHLAHLADCLLAVADDEGVDEVRHGLGVVRAVPAGDDERRVRCSALTPDGHAGEVEAVQDVRVHELGGEVEGDDVEVAGRAVGLDREQRHAVVAELSFQVDPRRVRPLGGGIVAFVQDLVEDLQALVGEPHLVRIGVHEEPGRVAGPVGRRRRPSFHSDVPSWFLDPGQERLDPRPQAGHLEPQCTGWAADHPLVATGTGAWRRWRPGRRRQRR